MYVMYLGTCINVTTIISKENTSAQPRTKQNHSRIAKNHNHRRAASQRAEVPLFDGRRRRRRRRNRRLEGIPSSFFEILECALLSFVPHPIHLSIPAIPRQQSEDSGAEP